MTTPGLWVKDPGQRETLVKGWYGRRRTHAPEDLEPSGPMLAKIPAFAIGNSSAMYNSMGEGPKNFST